MTPEQAMAWLILEDWYPCGWWQNGVFTYWGLQHDAKERFIMLKEDNAGIKGCHCESHTPYPDAPLAKCAVAFAKYIEENNL